MRFAFTDDQLLLRDAVRDLLAKECAPDRVRAAWDDDGDGLLTDVGAGLASMGVPGLLVPEAHGGMGMTELELVLVLEETGRAALPGPIVETVAVAAPLLGRDRGELGEVLAGIAEGTVLVTTAVGGDPFLTHADRAQWVIGRAGESSGDGDRLVLAGVDVSSLERQPSVDGGRRLFRGAMTAERIALDASVEDAFDRAALGAAAQLLGLADRMLEMTTDYVKQREQFGVPIGSFQAVKHQLADALLALAFARPVVYHAAYSVAHDLETRSCDVSMAKAFASDAAHRVGRTALQCHGAIGYTVEYDLHLYLKRAWALAAWWGDADWHRDRVGTLLGL